MRRGDLLTKSDRHTVEGPRATLTAGPFFLPLCTNVLEDEFPEVHIAPVRCLWAHRTRICCLEGDYLDFFRFLIIPRAGPTSPAVLARLDRGRATSHGVAHFVTMSSGAGLALS